MKKYLYENYYYWDKARDIYEIIRNLESHEKNFVLKLVERVWDCDDMEMKRNFNKWTL